MFNTIILGDCLQIMKNIPDNSIDLIISDPPYNLFNNVSWDKKLNLEIFWKEIKRIKKEHTPILIFASGKFLYELYNSNPSWYKYELIWKKSKAGNPFLTKYMPLKKHEYIVVFGEKKINYYPQLIPGKPYKRKLTKIKKNNLKYGIKSIEIDNKGTRHPSTILDFPQKWRRQDQLHPTQKPVELLQWLIKSYSKENDIVLDPTMGSGTTIIASILEKRKYIGIEMDEKYFEISKERIYKIKDKNASSK